MTRICSSILIPSPNPFPFATPAPTPPTPSPAPPSPSATLFLLAPSAVSASGFPPSARRPCPSAGADEVAATPASKTSVRWDASRFKFAATSEVERLVVAARESALARWAR